LAHVGQPADHCHAERRLLAAFSDMADSYHEAEAVIDEVTLLEAALREAVESKRRLATPMDMDVSPGRAVYQQILAEHLKIGAEACDGFETPSVTAHVVDRFDQAVASYGVQLKAWIDVQVDSRLNFVLQGFLEGDLAAVCDESSATLAVVQRMHDEIDVLKNTQAKLLAVVEGISEELARLKTVVAACQLVAQLKTAVSGGGQVREELVAAVEKVMAIVDDLKNGVSVSREQDIEWAERLAATESVVEDFRRLHEKHEASFGDLTRLHNEAFGRHQRSTGELISAVETLVDMKQDLSGFMAMVRRLEDRFQTVRAEVTAEVREEVREDVRRLVDDSQVRLGEDLVAFQEQLIAELRAETKAAFRSEAAAVAALDEQLWLTDQRLGQRIDELRESLGCVCIEAVPDLVVVKRHIGDKLGSEDLTGVGSVNGEDVRVREERDFALRGRINLRGIGGSLRSRCIALAEEVRIEGDICPVGSAHHVNVRGAGTTVAQEARIDDEMRPSERNVGAEVQSSTGIRVGQGKQRVSPLATAAEAASILATDVGLQRGERKDSAREDA